MHPSIEEKIRQYKKYITHKAGTSSPANTSTPPLETNLSRVIRSEEDAEMFMAQVNCLIERSKRKR